MRNTRQRLRFFAALLFLLGAFSLATAQDAQQPSDAQPQPSLPSDLGQMSSSELLIQLQAKINQITEQLSNTTKQLQNSEATIAQLEAKYTEQANRLQISNGLLMSLQDEKSKLESEKEALQAQCKRTTIGLKLWRSAAFAVIGAGMGFAIDNSDGAGIGAGAGVLLSLLF
jgi:septal ring factor EnvC (AmiA/AmiB activator)